ncbi:MAG: cytochrome c [Gammaproteobacteria bacterium]|nr:cytochrome c [Gammaproteobacteria bacterium]MCB1926002.1 cytochrome c [Gammaproteobacteria bacterium]
MRWLAPVIFSLSCGALAAAGEPDAQRQAELRYLLSQDCGSCHGLTLKGGLGPPLTPEALAGKPAEFLQFTIMEGRPGTAMPPWRGLLNDAEGRWLADHLLSRGTQP